MAEELDDAEGFSVKTTLLEAVVLLCMLMVELAMDALEAEEEVMTETAEALPML